MKKTKIFLCIILSIIAIGIIQNACIPDERIYQGKVIDAETLKPVEGVLVIVVWTKERFMAYSRCKVKNAIETLTDKNGDWSITGPEGNNTKIGRFFQYFGFYRSQDPLFEFYKPGLTELTAYSNFTAYPYASKEGDLIGIIFLKPGDSENEARKYYDTYKTMSVPFVPIDNPEKRLRELDFSFEYPENTASLNSVWCINNNVKRFWLYTVVGLRKAKTRKERLDAMDLFLAGACDWPSKIHLPIKTEMINKERDLLFGSRSRR